ncbi:MAG: AI-2E family transporter [Deltaproteobacteria bacterium]|nr:AI-2E family transporter [Deltaproteobacteria bacterium]
MEQNAKTGKSWSWLFDKQIILLTCVLVVLLLVIAFFGDALAPFFAALVLSYLMDGLVRLLERRRIPRFVAAIAVFSLFFVFFLSIFIWLLPILTKQLTQLLTEVPRIVAQLQEVLNGFQARYLSGNETQYLQKLIPKLAERLEEFVGNLAGFTLMQIPSILALTIYLILVPFLVLFFLKDKKLILDWLLQFIPHSNELLFQVLTDVDRQIGNLLRGKSLEIIIMTVSTSIVFWILDFKFAILTGILTGLSTIVPYIGVAVVTIPVLVLAYAQWGWTIDMFKVGAAYGILQLIDGNILAPLILGSSVKVHPTAIIFSIMVCGAVWGFWGVVFAIPIVSLFKSLLDLALPYVLKTRKDSELPPGSDEALSEE